MLKKIILGIMALALVAVAVYKWMPVGEEVNPLVYFDEFKNNAYNLVYEDQRIGLEEPIVIQEDIVYVSYDFARDYISDRVFYDKEEQILTLTSAKEVLRLYEGSDKGKINEQSVSIKMPIKEWGGQLYIPSPLLKEKFGLDIVAGLENKLFIAQKDEKDKEVAILKRGTSLRTHPQKRSIVVENLQKGQQVSIFKTEGDFLRVRSEQGVVGYIPKGDITEARIIAGISPQLDESAPIANPLQGKVKLVWDQLGAKTAGNWSAPKYVNIKDANVISPTWFEFEDKEGNLVDRGTSGYVTEAKLRGLQVWPLMSHNFQNPEFTKPILSSTQKRQHVIDQLLEKSDLYGFDGINIDIENIQKDFSNEWVQFMRELSVQAKNKGLTLSVDVYIPSNWSNHYEREKIAEVSDYFIVMAYDQHWSGSEVAGSVSELPWVEEGVQKNLQEVPKEKLVLGIPFYTRIWEESSQGLKSTAYAMNPAASLVEKWGVEPVLNEASGQKYAETIKDDVIYKVWLEDKDSVTKRLDIIDKYELAGYAAWKLGLETADIWDALATVK